ncbi:MAG: sensor histidine kinase [Pseudomonadota bacterium]|uniref:sensor histidine kinase n=1 Tax=Roseovarius TaxID=74030 RepID=UPI0022A8435E|nr:sensor histidine kinase [Roseovarius sp. EGI FJ00037]MCZ0814285.1 sensor histidine kinase [Roseovarius sp. EGI FJ00037]
MIDRDAQSNASQVTEANHRIANHLALLACHVRLKGAELVRRDPPPKLADLSLLLDAIGAQITAISQLHRLLSSEGTESSADLSHHLGMICSALGSGVSGDVVIVESLASDCTIAPQHLLPTAQIVTEVMTNAIKYGRRPGRSGRIVVCCSKDASGTVLVEILDNGPGLPANGLGSGFGYRLVQALVGQIDGAIEYRSTNQGLTVCLSLPLEETKADTEIPTPVGAGAETPKLHVFV